jgi:hypothetical protein
VSRLRWLVLAALVAGGVAVSALAASDQGPGTDFHAKWMFGRLFQAGEPVYVLRPDVRGPPTYPPFAVMAFQVLGWLPLKLAAGLFCFLNLVLTVAAVALTRRVVRRLWPASGERRWPLVAAIICSGQFYLNNFNLVQIDALLFVVVLLGIDAYLHERDVAAATAFVLAAATKLVPSLFVAWLLLRGRRRAALAVGPLVAACIGLPILQRGLERGVRDLEEYHAVVLQGFGEGRVFASYTNQSLGAAIHRAARPPQKAGDWDYRIIPGSETTATVAHRTSALALLVGLPAVLVFLRVRGEPLSAFELAAVFLTGHLLSAMTWKSHLVTLLFVAYAFLSIPPHALSRGWRIGWTAGVALLVGIGVTGRDIVGNTVHHWIGGYSVIVWTMVLAWGASLCLSHRRLRVWERAAEESRDAQPGA